MFCFVNVVDTAYIAMHIMHAHNHAVSVCVVKDSGLVG